MNMNKGKINQMYKLFIRDDSVLEVKYGSDLLFESLYHFCMKDDNIFGITIHKMYLLKY